jgi:hypothetical protein
LFVRYQQAQQPAREERKHSPDVESWLLINMEPMWSANNWRISQQDQCYAMVAGCGKGSTPSVR